MAAIINNTTEEAVKSNLENYYNTILNNKSNDDVNIIYDLKETSLLSRLRNKSNIFNNGADLSYFKDMAYMGKDFSTIRANTGIKLEFAMRDIFGKAKNMLQRFGQGKLKGTETEVQETTNNIEPEIEKQPNSEQIKTPVEEQVQEESKLDVANNSVFDAYSRLQLLFSHINTRNMYPINRWKKLVAETQDRKEISQEQAETLIQAIDQIISELQACSHKIGNNVFYNSTIENANSHSENEENIRKRVKINPLYDQILRIVKNATSYRELNKLTDISFIYNSEGCLSESENDEIKSAVLARAKELEQPERATLESQEKESEKDKDDAGLEV